MTTAERIFEEVRALPETQAREVLDFVSFLKSRQTARQVCPTGHERIRSLRRGV
jgi:hypothetical protein